MKFNINDLVGREDEFTVQDGHLLFYVAIGALSKEQAAWLSLRNMTVRLNKKRQKCYKSLSVLADEWGVKRTNLYKCPLKKLLVREKGNGLRKRPWVIVNQLDKTEPEPELNRKEIETELDESDETPTATICDF
jgi:hypothetical protein